MNRRSQSKLISWWMAFFAFVCIYTFLLRCQHTTSVLQMRPWLFIRACYQTRLHTHMSTVIIERVCECL